MVNTLLSEAIREAYASAPADLVIIHTMELRHSTFAGGVIRIVQAHKDLEATLEASAPLNPSETVTFKAFAFQFTLPSISEQANPTVTLAIDNVDRSMLMNVEKTLGSDTTIKLTYRPYLSDDLSGPQFDPPLHLEFVNISADVFRVTGKARFPDLTNIKFPRVLYTTANFPGLAFDD